MGDGCDFEELLAHHGVRSTSLRMTLLEILGESARAMKAPEILREIKGRRPIDKVTVYRILEEFTRRGLLRRLSVDGRAYRYELACEHNPPHPHFQCSRCGEVQCLDPVSLDRVWTQLREPLGERADGIEIRVAGVCHRCRGTP
jgi:Fur family ferric uptake transcriptional regulator